MEVSLAEVNDKLFHSEKITIDPLTNMEYVVTRSADDNAIKHITAIDLEMVSNSVFQSREVCFPRNTLATSSVQPKLEQTGVCVCPCTQWYMA